jgi:hypothetical protein
MGIFREINVGISHVRYRLILMRTSVTRGLILIFKIYNYLYYISSMLMISFTLVIILIFLAFSITWRPSVCQSACLRLDCLIHSEPLYYSCLTRPGVTHILTRSRRGH